jgi:hypothetical protein
VKTGIESSARAEGIAAADELQLHACPRGVGNGFADWSWTLRPGVQPA